MNFMFFCNTVFYRCWLLSVNFDTDQYQTLLNIKLQFQPYSLLCQNMIFCSLSNSPWLQVNPNSSTDRVFAEKKVDRTGSHNIYNWFTLVHIGLHRFTSVHIGSLRFTSVQTKLVQSRAKKITWTGLKLLTKANLPT